MIHHVWSVISRDSVINAENNSISLNDVVEEVTVTIDSSNMPKDVKNEFKKNKKIVVPFSCMLTSTFFRDNIDKVERYEALVKLLSPESVLVNETKNTFVMEKSMKRLRNRIRFENIPIELEGTYVFQVFVGEENSSTDLKAVATIPVDVKFSFV